jgi:hypothetical protein
MMNGCLLRIESHREVQSMASNVGDSGRIGKSSIPTPTPAHVGIHVAGRRRGPHSPTVDQKSGFICPVLHPVDALAVIV